jgi:hypothetical protein
VRLSLVGLCLFGAVSLVALAAGAPRPAEREGIAPSALRFDGARALAEVDAFLLAGGGPRPAGSEANARARAHLADRLRRFGSVEEQAFERRLEPGDRVLRAPWWKERARAGDVFPLANLFLDRPGESEEVVLLACHHDSVPGAPGAEDDASAVGALLELAAALEGRRLARTVRLAFFDGEELGLVGSRDYVERLEPAERERIVCAIAVEMVGWKEGAPTLHFFRSALYGKVTVPSAEFLQRVLDAASRGGSRLATGDPFPGMSILYQSILRMVRPPLGSDEGPFAEVGIPAALLAASSFSRFYPEYHRESDALDRLDARTLEGSGRALEAAVLELSRAPRPGSPGEVDLLLRSRPLREPWLRALAAIAAGILSAAAFERRGRGAERAAAAGAAGALVAGALVPGGFDLPLVTAGVPAALFASFACGRGRALRIPLAIAGALPGLALAGLLLAMRRAYRGAVEFDPETLPLALSILAAALSTFVALSSSPREDARGPEQESQRRPEAERGTVGQGGATRRIDGGLRRSRPDG